MAEVHWFPIMRHLRADAMSYILHYRRARVVGSGAGLSMWFNPMNDSVAEIPLDDRELSLVIHARSSDFQDITVQGVLTYRAAKPADLAQRIDFTIDLDQGTWNAQPLEKLELMLSQMAQEYALNYVTTRPVQELLTGGVTPIRDSIEQGLRETAALAEMGIALVTVRISSVKPSADLEKAIEAPTRERIKQDADEAAYTRRAMAVQKERAIAENEIQNRIELARREHVLLEQQGENARRQALDAADAAKIASAAEAENLAVVDGARMKLERDRIEFLQKVDSSTLLALAAREFAGKIDSIDHLNITPDLLSLLKDGLASAQK